MGMICLGLALAGLGFAALARSGDITIDVQNACLCINTHLLAGVTITRHLPLKDIVQMHVEKDTDSESTAPWKIVVTQRSVRFPKTLHSDSSEKRVRETESSWRNKINARTGISLPV
jgi:hypothetical protein